MGEKLIMAINNFKPFATGAGANVMAQSEWEGLTALLVGFSSGKASSAQINKALRQATTIGALVGQFIANSGADALDNADVNGLVTKFTNALTTNLELGKASKRNVGNAPTQIPDMSFFASAKGDNGYFSLPDGTIVQYGRATTVRNNEIGTVTLPFSFPSRFSQVVISHDDPSTTGAIAIAAAMPKTVSTFQVVVQKLNLNTTTGAVTLRTDVSPCYVRYFAVGS